MTGVDEQWCSSCPASACLGHEWNQVQHSEMPALLLCDHSIILPSLLSQLCEAL